MVDWFLFDLDCLDSSLAFDFESAESLPDNDSSPSLLPAADALLFVPDLPVLSLNTDLSALFP